MPAHKWNVPKSDSSDTTDALLVFLISFAMLGVSFFLSAFLVLIS